MNSNKFHIIIIGCQMNKSDAERLISYMEGHGYKHSDNQAEADLLFILTCGVRQSAEDRIYGLIPKAKKLNPNVKIVLTGCLSEREDVKKRVKEKVELFFNIKNLPSLQAMLADLEDINSIEGCDYLELKPKYFSKVSAFVPIGNGCNNFCSYCVVPYARGREVYREADEIIDEVKDLISMGYKEINLIAQNVNSYHDTKSKIDFADLLKKVDELEGKFWLRFSTSHPKDMSDKLINTMTQLTKLCDHLHLPVQSGDDHILKAMNRKYRISDYLRLVKKIKSAMPDISFSTDIIVGFPGETEKQFQNTKKIVEEVAYEMLYIGQYSPRPKTLASSMDDNIAKDEKKRREAVLMDSLREISRKSNEMLLGKKIQVLVESKNKKGDYIAKTRTSKMIILDNASDKDIGSFALAKVKNVVDFGLRGEIVA